MNSVDNRIFLLWKIVLYQSNTPLALKSGIKHPKVTETTGTAPDVFVFLEDTDPQVIRDAFLQQYNTFERLLSADKEFQTVFFLPAVLLGVVSEIFVSLFHELVIDLVPENPKLLRESHENLHNLFDALIRSKTAAAKAKFNILSLRRRVMLSKLFVVSVETDELSAALFDLQDNDDSPKLNLVESSFRNKSVIASIGDKPKYVDRLLQFISDSQVEAGIDFDKDTGIVIVHPGEIDADHTTLLDASRFNLRDINLREIIGSSFGVETVLVFHDGPALTLGEMKHGAGKDVDVESYFFFVVGAGVGGAIYINGHHHVGASFTAGDIGHTIVNQDGNNCPVCYRNGCLETYASRYWINKDIINRYNKERHRLPETLNLTRLTKLLPNITDPWSISTKQLEQAIDEKDDFAFPAIKNAAKWLGYGISIVIDFLNPHLIIMGGGLVDGIPLYFDLAVQSASELAYVDAWNSTKVVRAKLGRKASLWGGAELAWEWLKLHS